MSRHLPSHASGSNGSKAAAMAAAVAAGTLFKQQQMHQQQIQQQTMQPWYHQHMHHMQLPWPWPRQGCRVMQAPPLLLLINITAITAIEVSACHICKAALAQLLLNKDNLHKLSVLRPTPWPWPCPSTLLGYVSSAAFCTLAPPMIAPPPLPHRGPWVYSNCMVLNTNEASALRFSPSLNLLAFQTLSL